MIRGCKHASLLGKTTALDTWLYTPYSSAKITAPDPLNPTTAPPPPFLCKHYLYLTHRTVGRPSRLEEAKHLRLRYTLTPIFRR